MLSLRRLAVPAVAAAVLGTAGSAFMAFNSVPVSYAGTGNADVKGFNVSDVHYLLSEPWAGDSNITGVSFKLDKPASQVRAIVTEGQDGGQGRVGFPTCGSSDNGYSWTCTGATASIYQASHLYVNAVS